jgi:hypothetical protein
LHNKFRQFYEQTTRIQDYYKSNIRRIKTRLLDRTKSLYAGGSETGESEDDPLNIAKV